MKATQKNLGPLKFKSISLWLFCHCSTDVKIALFCSYCTCFYYLFLWTHYKKSTHSKLRVAFNNVYRRILKLPPLNSASTMYAINNIDSFEILIRKRIFGFTEPLNNCENTIIKWMKYFYRYLYYYILIANFN